MPSAPNAPAARAPVIGSVIAVPELVRQIPYGDGVYNQVMHFLIEEAHCLDEGLFGEWLKLVAKDILVTAPVRQSLHRANGAGFSASMIWLRDDFKSLDFKVRRLLSDTAVSEDPPSRERRSICNMRLHETAVADEYFAQSHFTLLRLRGDAHVPVTLSARRDDVIRRTADGWRLARRTILLDQSVFGAPTFGIF